MEFHFRLCIEMMLQLRRSDFFLLCSTALHKNYLILGHQIYFPFANSIPLLRAVPWREFSFISIIVKQS